ncbi:4a-hydroxytetrahydrobiopterin dehydratase [Spirosomataceae bacterium TFI 002]|nr:4a-hydroxytetrahydrobiopterin dehydratase [Spirosomataceae bacterium TFI 002]
MWKEINNSLVKEFKFDNFQAAFAFMTRVAFLSEAQNHHPTLINTYSNVKIELNTHDAGNTITDKDRRLASAIDLI